MQVSHPKGGKFFCTGADDNIVEEREENREVGLCGFNYTIAEEY